MFRLISGVVSCVVFVAMTSFADAQIVRVGRFGGGVRIRAPFVSVDVLPYGGGTRVRAPFTSVNTGAYGYGYRYRGRYGYDPYGRVIYGATPAYAAPVYPRPIYTTPVYPTPANPQANGYQAARPATQGSSPERLRASAQQLLRSLSARGNDSSAWLEYLAPDRIIETIDRGRSPDSLRTLLTNYDGVVGNASLSSISRASGFRETHQWLRAFVESPPAKASKNAEAPMGKADSASVAPADGGTNEPPRAGTNKPADGEVEEEEAEELPLPPVPTPL